MAGDRQAGDEVSAIMRPLLVQRLKRWSTGRDDSHAAEIAVDDALIRYVKEPELFDPERGTHETWLVAVSRNFLRDGQRTGRRSARREVAAGLDLASASGAVSPSARRHPAADRLDERIAQLPERRDRSFLGAIVRGESIETQARILGFGDLDDDDRRTAVRRAIARIKKWVQRHVTGRQGVLTPVSQKDGRRAYIK
jgi:DNA-directed RNA polymerase specialized sigma24 family protein